jgi:hypothetical protein
VVEVHSDLTVPSQMDELRVEVGTGTTVHFDSRYTLGTGPGQITLPRRVALVPQGSGTPTVVLEVAGLLRGQVVVSRRAVLPFIAHQSLFLRIDLLQSCAVGQGAGCGTGNTCVAGSCVPEVVDSTKLPRFVPRQPIEPLTDAAIKPEAATDGPADSAPSPDAPRDAPPAPEAGPEAPDAPPLPTDGPLKANGVSCGAGNECVSGICTDGVCCGSKCDRGCEACNVDGQLGSCRPVPAGQDPHAACVDDGASSCGKDGTCDGAGACRRYDRTTTCAPPSCSGESAIPARMCDGAGACAAAVPVSCAPFVCRNGACVMTCSGPGDCAPPSVCRNGACVPAIEDCTNGIDDDGDNAADCADSDCGAFTCAAGVPPGWNGPVAFAEGKPNQPVACQGPYADSAYQGKGGLTCPAATCSACGCTSPESVGCSAPTLGWYGFGCMIGISTPTKAETTCTVAGSIDIGQVDVGGSSPYGGRCTPSGGTAALGAAGWGTTAHACAPRGLVQGGCGNAQVCAPRPTTPFEGRLCVFAPGSLPCPPGYDHDRRIYFSGYSDTRTCSACNCGDPAGVTCGGRVQLYMDQSCPDSDAVTVALNTTCFDAGKYTQAAKYLPSISGGACPRSGGDPVGSCQPTIPTTVCCAP